MTTTYTPDLPFMQSALLACGTDTADMTDDQVRAAYEAEGFDPIDVEPDTTDTAFDHAAARDTALGVLVEVSESIGQTPIVTLGIEHDYKIRAHLYLDDARTLADRWSAGEPETLLMGSGATHYEWTFELSGTRVGIYAMSSPVPS